MQDIKDWEKIIVDEQYVLPKIVNYCSDRNWCWSVILYYRKISKTAFLRAIY